MGRLDLGWYFVTILYFSEKHIDCVYLYWSLIYARLDFNFRFWGVCCTFFCEEWKKTHERNTWTILTRTNLEPSGWKVSENTSPEFKNRRSIPQKNFPTPTSHLLLPETERKKGVSNQVPLKNSAVLPLPLSIFHEKHAEIRSCLLLNGKLVPFPLSVSISWNCSGNKSCQMKRRVGQ